MFNYRNVFTTSTAIGLALLGIISSAHAMDAKDDAPPPPLHQTPGVKAVISDGKPIEDEGGFHNNANETLSADSSIQLPRESVVKNHSKKRKRWYKKIY